MRAIVVEAVDLDNSFSVGPTTGDGRAGSACGGGPGGPGRALEGCGCRGAEPGPGDAEPARRVPATPLRPAPQPAPHAAAVRGARPRFGQRRGTTPGLRRRAEQATHGLVDAYLVLAADVPDEARPPGLRPPRVRDRSGAFADAYAPHDGEAFLVRPDGHPAGRHHPATPARLTALLRRTFVWALGTTALRKAAADRSLRQVRVRVAVSQ